MSIVISEETLPLDVDFIRSRQKDAVHHMIRRYLQLGQTAVDVGAAHGETVATMRACVGPAGRVIAIEPRETAIPGADVVHRVAVSARSVTTTTLFLADPPTGSSLVRAAVPIDRPPIPLAVPVRQLDDLVETADVVKVDVQGAEWQVLRGARRLTQTCPVWILEIWPYGLQTTGISMETLWTGLLAMGLLPYDVDGRLITLDRVERWMMRIRTPVKHTNWACVRG